MRPLQRVTRMLAGAALLLATGLAWAADGPGAQDAVATRQETVPEGIVPAAVDPAGAALSQVPAPPACTLDEASGATTCVPAEPPPVCTLDEVSGETICVPAEPLPPPPPEPFALVGEQVQPGSNATIDWRGIPGDGAGRGMPVMVAHGVHRGPVLCLFAAIHGDELNGIESVRRIVQRTDPRQLAGTLVAVPVVNLGGYARGSRYLPDRRDLNRAFPGSARGSAASRLAHALFDNVVRHCEAVVDFHTGSFDRDNLPQVRADLRLPASLELARGFGATVVLHSPGQKGMLRHAASSAGIAAATFEVGAPGVLQPDEIEVAVAAIEGLMHRLGMRDTAVPVALEPQAVFYASRWIRADTPGLLLSDVELGQRVAPGQRLGRVIDPLADREVEVLSPFHGRVLGMSQNRQVLPGFALFHLGEQTSEAQAVQEAAVAPEDAGEEEEDPDSVERD